MTELPSRVKQLLVDLLNGIHLALDDNVAGIYLRGSLALGGYNPETSDVDLLVVTERRVSDAEFSRLADLHDQIPTGHGAGDSYYEVSYIDRESVREFSATQQRHPTVGVDWAFGWAEHHDNFIFELWTVREHGAVLTGPEPETLIDPIGPERLRSAVRNEFQRNLQSLDADFLATREYQAFAIETICRGLYTLQAGSITTKPMAVSWALEHLREPWLSLAEWSREHHADKTTDSAKIPDVMAFLRWAADA